VVAVTPSKRGRSEEAIRLTAPLRDRITKLIMVNLTPEAMAGFKDERLKICKADTVIGVLSVLSAIINHATRDWGIATQNPVEVIRKPPMPPGRDSVLSQAEEAALLDQLKVRGRRNPLMQPMAILAIGSAMRRGEIIGIEWKHIDFESRTVFLPLTKNGLSRLVPLPSRSMATLQSIAKTLP
jgi:integrase